MSEPREQTNWEILTGYDTQIKSSTSPQKAAPKFQKNSQLKEDDIYIDCHPVNASGEILIEDPKATSKIVKGAENLDMKKLIKNPIFDIILGIVGLFVIIQIFKKLWKLVFKSRN